MKPGRNGLAARKLHYQILRAPSLTLGDGNDTLKVPRGAGRFFTCYDEESEMLSSSYLTEVAEGIIWENHTNEMKLQVLMIDHS
jgi:hypothetical protein